MTREDSDLTFERRLHAWLVEWQRILQLQDWEIRLDVKRAADMSRDNAYASCEVFSTKRRAYLEFRHVLDHPTRPTFDPDPERDVVHELIHIHLDPWDELIERDEGERLALEQAVHALSTALVNLKRSTLMAKKKTAMSKTKGGPAKIPSPPPPGLKDKVAKGRRKMGGKGA